MSGTVETSGPEAASSGQRERDLVERHRLGDQKAFEEFYRLYGPMVYNLALRQCGDPELAKDLAQESFVRLFRHLRSFQGRSSLKTWTFRVVVNHCRSRLARRKVDLQPLVDESGLEREIRDPGRGPAGRVEAADSRRLVGRALLSVEPAYREAVILRDLEEFSYQEIAEILEVPVGTVRSRIARGRESLRTALEATTEFATGTARKAARRP